MPAPSLDFKVEPTSHPYAINDSSVMKRPRERGGGHPARSPTYTVEKENEKEKEKNKNKNKRRPGQKQDGDRMSWKKPGIVTVNSEWIYYGGGSSSTGLTSGF
jgi:hypothetical protein